MDRDQRPADVFQDIRDLQRDVKEAQGAAPRRQPLTTASGGWIIPNNSPDVDDIDDGGHLGAAGDEPLWTESSGVSYSLKPPEVPEAPYVAHTPSMGAGADAPSTYSDVYVEALREDVRALRETVADLIDSFRSVDLLHSSP